MRSCGDGEESEELCTEKNMLKRVIGITVMAYALPRLIDSV